MYENRKRMALLEGKNFAAKIADEQKKTLELENQKRMI